MGILLQRGWIVVTAISLFLSFYSFSAVAGTEEDRALIKREQEHENSCVAYFTPNLAIEPRRALEPYFLISKGAKEVTVAVPGLGSNLDQQINISGLNILSPEFSLHLGPMTYDEAEEVARTLTVEGGGWRLPFPAEVLALKELGGWQAYIPLFRLNTVWASRPSENEWEDRKKRIAERSRPRNVPWLARQIAADFLSDIEFEEARSRYAFNLITGKATRITRAQSETAKFPVLFVRDQK